MHRKIALLLFATACVDVEPVGISTQDSTVNTDKTNRWYSSTIKYYADPNLSTNHWKALWHALHDNYNVLTSVDFEPGCTGTDETHPPTCPPAVSSSTPYVMYVDANIATGGRTMSGSDLHAASNQLSEVAPTRAAMRNWREVRTEAHGFCTDTTHCTDTGQVHDDYVVAFPTFVSGGNSDWGPDSSLDLRTPLHETGHVLGMIHEQRRPDATNHLNIYTCCVGPDYDASIQPYDADDATYLGKWDYDSIMMYSSSIESGQSCYNFLAKAGEGIGSAPSPMPTATCGSLQQFSDSSPTLVYATSQSGTKVTKKHVLSKEDINTVFQMYPQALGGDEANDHFGKAMAAGDFDHDGYTDLAVGVPHERYKSDTVESGMVYVFKGTYTGLEPWMLLHTGGVPYAELGSSLAALDVDGDGTTDLVVGAPGTDVGTGAVWLYRGSPTGLGSGRQVPRSGSVTDRFGETVHAIRKTATEVDFAVGMPSRNLVEVYDASGSWSSLAVTKVRTYTGPAGSQYGAALGAGEVDGDGNHDLLIGAPGASRVYIAHGITTGPGTLVTWISDPYGTGNQFGAAVIGAYLESGADDIVVGAPGADSGRGRVYRFNHAFTLVDTLLPTEFGQNPVILNGGHFGQTLAAGNLYTNSTYDHLVVGMPDASISGQVGLYHMTNGSLEHGNVYESLVPSGTHTHFGAALAIGNFDDKGPADLAIGEPERSESASNTGKGWILHGRAGYPPSYTADGSENNTTLLTQGGNLLNYRR